MASAVSPSIVRERFLRLYRSYATTTASDVQRVDRAFHQAVAQYGDTLHWTGETVLEHCIGVLEGFLRFQPDDDGIIACLLHHVLDDGRYGPDHLEREWGIAVRSMVTGVHLLSQVTMRDRRTSLQKMRLMFLRVSDDMRVVLLILCDRQYILTRCPMLSPEQQRHVSRDVLHIFAPVAARLGIYALKHAMETRAFPLVYPTDAQRIDEQLDALKKQHGSFLSDTAERVRSALQHEGVLSRVEAREKQPYSIFRKMRTKSVSHAGDLYDLFALRVIVPSESACYQALGLLHHMAHPVVNRFKDFVSFPKPNGYRSLHTTLVGLPGVPEGVFVEVQIRTDMMHREADLGLAAHWSYREGGRAEYAAQRARLQQALSAQQSIEEQVPALADHIFTLTPAGDIVELPEGATPLDFAFHVHTMLGLSFRGARVNGSMVSMTHELENGDIVEILRHSDPKPSSHWLSLLKTASARTRLKHFLAERERPVYLEAGRAAVNRELKEHGLDELDPNLTLLRSMDGERQTIAEREDALVQIGKGSRTIATLLRHIDGVSLPVSAQQDDTRSMKIPDDAVRVRMEDGIPMPLRFARCCHPEEGQRGELAGVIGRDGSIRVHRGSCKLLQNVNPDRRIGVMWDKSG